ncbi:hypothetical protein INR49_029766 [Caranx melampygus]|nr:hypothetical protein INR49_029766 [Caranx melampygus]
MMDSLKVGSQRLLPFQMLPWEEEETRTWCLSSCDYPVVLTLTGQSKQHQLRGKTPPPRLFCLFDSVDKSCIFCSSM